MRHLFGFAGKAAAAIAQAPTAAERGPGFANRRETLDQISTFLLDNGLDVQPQNLAIAHAIVTGANPRLARQIVERQIAHEPVTQLWLDERLAAAPAGEKEANLDRLIGKLDRSLHQFSRNASDASATASDFHIALKETAHSLQSQTAGVADIAAMAELTRVMIERTSEVEAEMRRREAEAASLRTSLAHARRDADVDHLTGLANRRAFEIVLDREYREARAAVEPLTIAFCDIDRFKLINDTHGHDTGDRVIQAIAEVLQRISGRNCHVARHGGEEFVLLFRGVTTAGARSKLDDTRENFARRKLVNRETDAPIGSVTFSGGVADVFAYADPRAALKAADAALYEAKQQGRNRILIAAKPS